MSLSLCQKTVVDPAPVGKCLLQVFNLAEGDITVTTPGNLFPEPIPYLQVSEQKEGRVAIDVGRHE